MHTKEEEPEVWWESGRRRGVETKANMVCTECGGGGERARSVKVKYGDSLSGRVMLIRAK